MNRRGQSAKEAFVGIEGAFPRNTPPGVQQNSRRASQKARRLFRGSARSRIRRCSGAVSAGQTVRQPFSRLDVFAEMPASTCSRSGREQAASTALPVSCGRGAPSSAQIQPPASARMMRAAVWSHGHERSATNSSASPAATAHSSSATHPMLRTPRTAPASSTSPARRGCSRKKVCRTPGVVSNASRSTPQCET